MPKPLQVQFMIELLPEGGYETRVSHFEDGGVVEDKPILALSENQLGNKIGIRIKAMLKEPPPTTLGNE